MKRRDSINIGVPLIKPGTVILDKPPGVPTFLSDLESWYKNISGDEFAEKINTNVAKFLPAIAQVDGTSQLQFIDLTGVAIVSSAGTSAPSIVGDNIDFTVGTCADLLLDDGTFIPDVYSGYDTAGANDAMVVNITITHSSVGSLHKSLKGYTLYQNLAKDKWQVPFLLTGVKKPAPTVPAGYNEIRDLPGNTSKWNMADTLLGFNEAQSADPEFEIFDRSNVVIQSDESRAPGSYYDSTNLATRSRYHITEIADPRIYYGYYNVGYAGKPHAKIQIVPNGDTHDIIRYDEQLVYISDKILENEISVQTYCNIHVYWVLDINDDWIFDENDYIVIDDTGL